MENTVKFISTTQAKYDALVSKDAGSLYFTSDTHRIYKGSELFSISDVTNLATKSDATLTERGDPSTPGFSAWVCAPSTYNGHDITIVASPHPDAGMMDYTPYADGEQIGVAYTAAEDATRIHWESTSYALIDIVATRTALQGYQLGDQ